MSTEPVIVREHACRWETWPEGEATEKGLVFWKSLISGDRTPSEALTMGIARIPTGGKLNEHRHRQAEIYLILEGTGSVQIGGEWWTVERGTAVFIPGDTVHSCENTGASDLRFAYIFPAGSFEEVEYVFGAE
jgi:quercetin dioxygenase-like cupin family protein